ncbi:CCR4-Not complex 3'-5'-exoribonuclease subunit Ccr4 isoform X3 [Scyliorhinus canicula]|uniref:CCR4-Not complex 3'-5'-exoribonuclease subunit Ccr4 isoform X3 n=1 Tax=Scyliorhinus canicula TaxID=7830 RepID=UPI0018F5D0C6|nr:CCR4-Not complex 3'-5'-exoribonuclease subunit Ccr4 isoform X3 [Scyliorhinus canicula]
MSKHPQLLRRPLPPKDALYPKPCEPRSRSPDKISTKDTSAPHGGYSREQDSTNQPVIPSRPSAPNRFLSSDFKIEHRQNDEKFAEDDLSCNIPAKFSLDGFLYKPSVNSPPLQTKNIVLSHYNYEKIVKLLAIELWSQNQEKVNIVELPFDDIPTVSRRIPERQRIIEMIAAAKTQESHCGHGISSELPSYPGTVPNAEEYKQFLESSDTESSTTEEEPERRINPYDFFIQRSLAIGSDCLNFRIYGFSRLEVLNLRDNPIMEISSDIAKLTNLRIFDISFCLVSTLPAGLFLLSNLQSLNVAYNKISLISNDIKNLRNLQFLNVDGNELTTLPCELLQLQLKNLRMENNYTNSLFWEGTVRNQPQRLTDLAAVTFSKNHLGQQYTNISKDVQDTLNNATICDCCKGPLYGAGLKIIKQRKTIFNTESIPLLFHACSPSCYKWFLSEAH